MGDMRPGVLDDSACAVSTQAVEDLVPDFFRRYAGLGVVDHALGEDASADHDRLAGHFSWNLFNVGA
jgi:hypothetical protein